MGPFGHLGQNGLARAEAIERGLAYRLVVGHVDPQVIHRGHDLSLSIHQTADGQTQAGDAQCGGCQ